MTPRLRDAVESECELLSELAVRSKAIWGYDAAFLEACREELRVRAEAVRAGRVRVLETDEQLLGMHSLIPLSRERADVGHLFVEPRFVGLGYGRRLWIDLVDRARAEGHRIVEVVSDPQAEAFYLAQGCVRRGERPSGSVPGRSLPYLEFRL